MNSSYFLTPQSANLMEDFVREIGRDSSLFLLFGQTGVGKTSLLMQLRDRRLQDINTHWLDFNQDMAEDRGEELSETVDFALILKKLAEDANQGDVIIVDHFEAASNRAQHQLFESWTVDGRDKKLNIIVAADAGRFNQFRQLAQQFQIQARSFQLMPFSQVESEAYLRSVLFPEEAFGKLIIPRSLQQQLRRCNGVIGRLVEFAEREANQIGIYPHASEKSSYMPIMIVGLLTLVLVVVGYAYYSTQMDKVPAAIKMRDIPAPDNQNANEQIASLPEIEEVAPASLAESRDESVEVDTTIVNPTENTINETLPEQLPVAQENTAADLSTMKTVVDTKVDWFQSVLETSRNWINNGDDERGTIQIMSFGLDRQAPGAYEKYLQTLEEQDVDTTLLHIFQTRANNEKIYSIVYGEYPGRSEASAQIKSLPEILGANSPIPRTTGSISREIERVRNQ